MFSIIQELGRGTLVLHINYILEYHWQDRVSSGYMFIYGYSSPVWPDWTGPKHCGIFGCGCNAYRSGNYLSYAEFVGSPTNSIIFT